jgi:hypothetical protein
MDEICAAVAAKIYSAGKGGYAVIYADELMDVLPDESKNSDVLHAALKTLAKGGYIDVKYSKGDAYCISSLKKYELPAAETETETSAQPTAKISFWYSLLGGFAGGALGGILVALTALIF